MIKITFDHAGAGTIHKRLPRRLKVQAIAAVFVNSADKAVISVGSVDDKTAPDSQDAVFMLNWNHHEINLPYPTIISNGWISSTAAGASTLTVSIWGE